MSQALAQRIVTARHRAGITQLELAAELGVTERTVQAWESGKVVPRPKHRRLILAFVERYGEAA